MLRADAVSSRAATESSISSGLALSIEHNDIARQYHPTRLTNKHMRLGPLASKWTSAVTGIFKRQGTHGSSLHSCRPSSVLLVPVPEVLSLLPSSSLALCSKMWTTWQALGPPNPSRYPAGRLYGSDRSYFYNSATTMVSGRSGMEMEILHLFLQQQYGKYHMIHPLGIVILELQSRSIETRSILIIFKCPAMIRTIHGAS